MGNHGPVLGGAAWFDDGPPPPPMPLAACADHDPELWFTKGEGDGREAIVVCRSCPEIEKCFEYAMRTPLYGVWGGRTANWRTKHGAPPFRRTGTRADADQ